MSDVAATSGDWARRITECWRNSVHSILEVGRLLSAAREALPYGEFGQMIENNLPFSASTARRLMIIGNDSRLSNCAHVHALPAAWGTLYELTKLDDEQFEARLADGTIRPEMERRDIATEIKQRQRSERERDLGAKQTALPEKKYGVVLADCEWRYQPWSRETGMDRAADNHYPTSTLEVIKSRDVQSIAADDCVLFLWATAPMLPHALAVMEAWDFRYRSNYVWVKDRIGTGYWNRNAHEHLLIGVRGKIPAPVMGKQWKSTIEAPVGEHSAKPEIFLQMIEDYFPTLPKIELNRRGKARSGWSCWGLEAEQTDAAETHASALPAEHLREAAE